jgi:hypothetical protein
MNHVKRQRPWVDLLKPEKNVVLGVLQTIDPTVARYVPALLPVAWDRGIGELQRHDLLSAAERTTPLKTVTVDTLALSDAVGPNLQRLIDGTEQSHAAALHAVTATEVDAMMLDIERQLASGIPTADGRSDLEGTLGWPGMLLDRLRSVDRADALRRALLDWHASDYSFDLEHQDEMCRRILARVGSDVQLVVTGHTHLERAVVTANRAYYNTGTWIRSIRFPDVLLRDPSTFSQLYKLLNQATLGDLDNATVKGGDGRAIPLVADVTTALQITARTDAVVARLGHVVDDSSSEACFEEIAGSEFRGV